MPRGGGRAPKKNYKGRSRHFTDEETLKEQLDKERREKQWRKQRGDEDDDDEEEEKKKEAEGGISEESGSGSEEESDSEDDKHKGISHLIAIENPNRAMKKNKKVDALDTEQAGPQLSRKEREELEKQQAKERYQKMHMEGKTEEARNDLARLALIRKQREEAAKKREEERLENEAKTIPKS